MRPRCVRPERRRKDGAKNGHVAALATPTLLAIFGSGCAEDELPIVARGHYVEIATANEEPVCAGTTAFIDAYVENVAALLGESLPDRPFIRFEWRDVDQAVTSRLDTRWLVTASELPHEHELVHAVHREVWPASRPFLHEGLAVLLGDSTGYENGEWPTGEDLDALLEADSGRDTSHWSAWFIVSQVVRDHGFDGLESFWRAVPPDASADEIRDAYQALFDRPFATLFEPDLVEVPWMETPVEVPRLACYFAVCVAEPSSFVGDVWSAAAPAACEDDAAAVGPTSGRIGDVWRTYTVDLDEAAYHYAASGLASGVFRACELRCENTGEGGIAEGMAFDVSATPPKRQRWDVGVRLDDLPSEDAGEVRVTRLAAE